MLKSRQQRRRNRKLPDTAVPAEPPTAAPIGPAGGDLGGTYPNPVVVSLINVVSGPAVYPAGSAVNLTEIPNPTTLKSGIDNLDGSGELNISGLTTAGVAIGSWYGSVGVGRIVTMGSPLRVASDAGATDAGLTVCWISA